MIRWRPASFACITRQRPGFRDVAGLLQADLPLRALDEAVGVAELDVAVADLDHVLGRGRELADQRHFVRRPDERRQVARARLVAARQARRLDVVGVVHAEGARLVVHRRDEGGQPARIAAAERIGGPVLRRHQRQVQHVLAAQLGADAQARAAALLGVDVLVGDRDDLVERLLRLGDDHRRHELGERGDRQDGLGVLAEQDLVGVLVEDQGDARLQLERIGRLVQADHLAERRLGRLGADDGDAAPGRAGRSGPRAPGGPWRWRRSWTGGRPRRALFAVSAAGLGGQRGARWRPRRAAGRRGKAWQSSAKGVLEGRRRESRVVNKNAQDQKLARCF